MSSMMWPQPGRQSSTRHRRTRQACAGYCFMRDGFSKHKGNVLAPPAGARLVRGSVKKLGPNAGSKYRGRDKTLPWTCPGRGRRHRARRDHHRYRPGSRDGITPGRDSRRADHARVGAEGPYDGVRPWHGHAKDRKQPGGPKCPAVALGFLGRREFATGGPVQLLFIYDHDPVSAGAPGLSPQDWHGQLLQRFMRLVGDLSPEGILFEACPVYSLPGSRAACTMSALRDHFDNAASVAELRMLAHARVIEAEGDLGASFEALRESSLSPSP